jgi:hypothetical protein
MPQHWGTEGADVGGNSYYTMGDSLIAMRDAAIESTMHLLGIGGTVSGGFDGGNPPVRVSPLGGHYEGSTMVQGGQVTDPTGQYAATIPIGPEWPFHDLPSMVEYYDNRINELFQDWWQIPQDRDFEGLIDQCGQGSQLLASDAQLDPGQGTASPFGANANLSQISTIQIQIGRFDGLAMQEFASNYANRLPIVVDGQDAVACFLWLGAAGEQEIWNRAMQGVADIAAQGRTAMEQCDDGGGDVSAVLSIAGALASVAGVVPGLGTGVSIGIKLASTALSTASKFAPKAPETVPLGADNPIAVLDNIKVALDKLSKQIADEEDDLAEHLTQVQGVVTSQAASFDIAAPPILDDTNPDHFRTPDDTRVHFGTLRTIARETMPLIAGEIKKAAGQFDVGSSSEPWSRPASIGSGSFGPYFEWSSLRYTLVGILDNTSLEIERAADHLEIVADDFDKTDGQVRADLEAHAAQIDKEDAPPPVPAGHGGHYPI